MTQMDQGEVPKKQEEAAGCAHRPIRLLVVVNVFEPDCAGGAAVFSDLCHELARRGMEVTVRCAYPYYPEWKDKSGENGWRIGRGRGKGGGSREISDFRFQISEEEDMATEVATPSEGRGHLTIERYGLFIPRKPGSLWQRLLYEGSFGLSLMRSLARGRGFDVVMVFCPLMGSVMFAGVNRLIYRRPLVLNVQDLPADAATGSGMVGRRGVGRVFSAIQGWLFNRADVWSSISPGMVARLEPMARRGQRVHYLPNHLHGSLAKEIAALPCKEGRAVGRPVRLFYSGNIGGKQDLARLCGVLHALKLDFTFLIRGEGSGAKEVREWVRSAGDERFTMGPLVDEAQLARDLHEADFAVIPEKQGCGSPFIPSKMIPAIAAGTPVLAVCDADGPFGEEMEMYGLGIRVDWDRVGELPRLVERVREGRRVYEQWQRQALERARFYEQGRVVDAFEGLLGEVAGKG